jgi:phenylpropionate dioxygenase-like ring-hydroxylating dioxygenase large terminal subunit
MTERIPLPDYPCSWYQVAYADELKAGEIMPLHYFGRELICYRGAEDGTAHVLDAYCAHLGAHIGHGGFVDGDCVRCPFHHWKYAADGRNVDIPYRDRSNRAARLRSWPTREVNGMILVWYSEQDSEPGWEVPEVPEYGSGGFVWDVDPDGRYRIATHPQEVFENTVDIVHFQYVHGTSGFGALELVEDGPMLTANAAVTFRTRRGDVQGYVESQLWGLGIDVVHPRGIADLCAFLTVTPVDPGVVDARYTFLLPSEATGGGASRGGKALKGDFLRQITQDIPIWEHKIYREHPKLAIGENPIPDYRRWAVQFYEATPAVA